MAVSQRPLIAAFEHRHASGAEVAVSLDVTLGAASTLVLFGPSGAGKTTTLRALAGLERPGRGRIVFGAETWLDAATGFWVGPERRRTGFVPQDAALFPHLSVRDNIGYALRGDRQARDRRVGELASTLGVGGLLDRRGSELSGGEAQKVALARALAPRPQLLLLDEPFASVDAPTRARLRREIGELVARSGVPAVLVTHDRTDAMAIGDIVAIMAGGRVRQIGPVADVFSRPADVEVAASVGVETVVDAFVDAEADGMVTLRLGSARLRAVAPDRPPAGAEVFACIRAEDVALERAAASGGSARNHVPARVVSILPEGPIERVTLDCGFPLAAVITRQAREEMSLRPGSQVFVAIKATSIHIVARTVHGDA